MSEALVVFVACIRCVLLEQQGKQLEAQLAEADKRLAELRIQHEQLQVSCDTQLTCMKQAAVAEKERLVAKHIDKIRRLKEAAKAQVNWRKVWRVNQDHKHWDGCEF